MGRGKGCRENRRTRRSGEDKAINLTNLIPGVICVLLITCFLAEQGVGGQNLVVTDLWDSPHRIEDICRGRATVFFVCDTELSICREGAVFFDARADEIEAHGFRAALIFTGEPAEVRGFALRTGLHQPVYVDSDRKVFEMLLDEKILPALVLVNEEGLHVRTLFGGGESLEGNISALIEDGEEGGRRWWLIIIPVAVIAILPFVLN